MFTQFRIRYPQGSLISELVTIQDGKYVVRVLIQAEGITLGTGLAAADTVEQAENCARDRALAVLDLNGPSATPTQVQPPRDIAAPVPEEPEVAPVKDSRAPLRGSVRDRTPESFIDERPAPSLALDVAQPSREDEDIPPPLPIFSAIDATPTTPPVSLPEPQPIEEKETPLAQTAATAQLSVEELPLATATVPPETPPPLILVPEEAVAEVPTSPLIPVPEEAVAEVPVSETPPPLIPVPEKAVAEVPAKKNQPLSFITTPLDFSDVIAKSNVELKRLGWTNERGKNYLIETYGKRSRQLLSDEELWEFLQYLESQPTP